MDTRTQIAAMCLQGLVANSGIDMTYDKYAEQAVKHTDALLLELARTAPPKPEPLQGVKAGDVLIGAGSGRLTLIAVDYPLAVVRYRNPITGAQSRPEPYDLRANHLHCTLASAEILAALAKE